MDLPFKIVAVFSDDIGQHLLKRSVEVDNYPGHLSSRRVKPGATGLACRSVFRRSSFLVKTLTEM